MIKIRTTLALVIKFVVTLTAAWIALGLVNRNMFSWILLVALTGTLLNYLIGDLIVLPAAGNIVASVGDGVMAVLTAYVLSLLIRGFHTSITSLALFGVLVAVVEYFFHQYLLREEKVAP